MPQVLRTLLPNFLMIVLALCAGYLLAGRKRPRSPWENQSCAWTFDRFWQNFDKFVVIFLFALTLAASIHMIHHGSDIASTQWIQGIVGQLLSLLAGLMGGAALARSKTEQPAPPAPPQAFAAPPVSRVEPASSADKSPINGA